MELETLRIKIKRWSEKEFGSQRLRGIIAHLRREVRELENNPRNLEEFADCQMLLMDALTQAGYNMDELKGAVDCKLEINKKRNWKEPNEDGSVEHESTPTEG